MILIEPSTFAGTDARWEPLPGIYRGIAHDAYHADRAAVSSTSLKVLLRSPAHFQASLQQPPKETPAQAFGSALHCLLLEPHKFHDLYAVESGVAEIIPADTTRSMLAKAQHAEMVAMCDAAKKHRAVSEMLAHGEAESTFCWTDEETGVLLKARPDWIQFDTCIWDVKTAENGSAYGFSRACANYDYHLSCAMYRIGVHALTGKWLPFRFVVLEKGGPRAVAVYEASENFIRRGERDFHFAVRRLAECRSTESWPGYQQDEIATIDLPPWK